MTTELRHRTCPLCEASCGLELTVDDGHVTLIRGDRDDVFSKGYLCPKGTVLGHLHDDPDRVRTPLRREGATWREVSWDEAFVEIGERLGPLLAEHGRDALGLYVGNPSAHNLSLIAYVPLFLPMCGTRNVYSAGTVDQWPKNVVGTLMYGGMWSIPVPDLDRNDYLLVLGGNPAASNGSLMTAPDALGRIDAIRDRGGRVVVVDPRRTGTVEHADEWVPIRPGTDALFLAAVVHVLFADGLVDLGRLEPLVDGLDEVAAAVAELTPEAVESTTGVAAATTRRLAHELAAAPAGCVYGRMGTCTQEFGTLASWLVEVANICTGNLDEPGGSMFPTPLAWPLVTLKPPGGYTFGTWRSRVRGAPEVLGQVPASCLAEEIDTPGDGQIRALVTVAGNPVLSVPDAGRLDAALAELDFMVSVDNYVNETTRHADLILPGESFLQQGHYDALLYQFAVRNVGRWSDPVFAPDVDRPREWEVLLTLGALVNGDAFPVDTAAWDDAIFAGVLQVMADEPGSPLHGRDPGELLAQATADGRRGPERLLDLQLRAGPYGDAYGDRPGGLTLDELRRHPHGLDEGPLVPRLPEVLGTPGGRIDLAPPHITADLPRLLDRLRRPSESLVLIGRRHLRSNNSWLHNIPTLVKGRDRCTILVHHDDATPRGLLDGAPARVTSTAGSVVAPVEVSDEMMPGVVSLPHGWGHDAPGSRMAVAEAHPGANSNVLAPGDLVDVPSGNQVVNGIPVEVTPA